MMRLFRLSAFVLALTAALVLGACNLSPEEETLPTATPTSQLSTKPTVTILTPANGATHTVNTELNVTATARDTVGVTRITMTANNVPVNPLHARGFVSIGCAPCTRAVKAGEDPRAGRWWWENESGKECGLHVGPESKGKAA